MGWEMGGRHMTKFKLGLVKRGRCGCCGDDDIIKCPNGIYAADQLVGL